MLQKRKSWQCYRNKHSMRNEKKSCPIPERITEQELDVLIEAKIQFGLLVRVISEQAGIPTLVAMRIFCKRRYASRREYKLIYNAMRTLILAQMGLTPQEANARIRARKEKEQQRYNPSEYPQRK